jgi:hypothetical protein
MEIDVFDDLVGEYPVDSPTQRRVARACTMRDRASGADWGAVSRFEVK